MAISSGKHIIIAWKWFSV